MSSITKVKCLSAWVFTCIHVIYRWNQQPFSSPKTRLAWMTSSTSLPIMYTMNTWASTHCMMTMLVLHTAMHTLFLRRMSTIGFFLLGFPTNTCSAHKDWLVFLHRIRARVHNSWCKKTYKESTQGFIYSWFMAAMSHDYHQAETCKQTKSSQCNLHTGHTRDLEG